VKKSVKSEKITEIGTPTTTRRHHKIWHHQPLPFPDTDNYTKISTSQNFNFTPLQNFRRFHSIAILEFFFLPLFHLILTSRQKVENGERDGEKNQGSWNRDSRNCAKSDASLYLYSSLKTSHRVHHRVS
jgi:hypothetical protein